MLSHPLPETSVLHLQRMVGNEATRKLLRNGFPKQRPLYHDLAQGPKLLIQRQVPEFDQSQAYKTVNSKAQITNKDMAAAIQEFMESDAKSDVDKISKFSVEWRGVLEQYVSAINKNSQAMSNDQVYEASKWKDIFELIKNFVTGINGMMYWKPRFEQCVINIRNAVINGALNILTDDQVDLKKLEAYQIKSESMWPVTKRLLAQDGFDIDAAMEIRKAITAHQTKTILELLEKFKNILRPLKIVYGALYKSAIEQEIRDHMPNEWMAQKDAFLQSLNIPDSRWQSRDIGSTVVTQQPLPNERGVASVNTNIYGPTSVDSEQETGYAFAHRYRGERAFAAQWIQFVWSEVYVSNKEGQRLRTANGAIQLITSNGPMLLTTDPAAPNLYVDAAVGTVTPYYEEQGKGSRGKDFAEILDSPGLLSTYGGLAVKVPEWDKLEVIFKSEAGNTVTATSHFDAFLIQDDRAVIQNHLSYVNQWKAVMDDDVMLYQDVKHDRAENQQAQPVDGLPANYKEALLKRFPKYTYIK
jgi:hypothetical protein